MKNIQFIRHFDTFELMHGLWERRKLFDAITLRQDVPGSYHKDTRTIFLIGPENPGLDTWYKDVQHKHYPPLHAWPTMDRFIQDIAARSGTYLGKVMLVSLKAGGKIIPHVDEGEYAQAYDRYHLPLVTNPYATMYSGTEAKHIDVGAFTKFNVLERHYADNASKYERIHLIVDIRKC